MLRFATPDEGPVSFEWGTRDDHPQVVALVAVAVLAAVGLALLGLPPLDLHGPLHRAGVMDPLCGMTRAVRSLTRGDVATAWRFNPGSFVLPTAAAAVVMRWAIGQHTGRWARVVLSRRVTLAVCAAGAALLEVNQQLHADYLR